MSGAHRTLSCLEGSGLRLRYLLLKLILIVSIAWSCKKKRVGKVSLGFFGSSGWYIWQPDTKPFVLSSFLAFPTVNAVLLEGQGAYILSTTEKTDLNKQHKNSAIMEQRRKR